MDFFHRTTRLDGGKDDAKPQAVSVFVLGWTIGMAAMMFPATVPMVLLYKRMVSRVNNDNRIGYGAVSLFSGPGHDVDDPKTKEKWDTIIGVSGLPWPH
jgi:hypothetical protein